MITRATSETDAATADAAIERADRETVVAVEDLVMQFTVSRDGRRRALRAVDGVSFSIGRGETLGLVGESGSGKTTVGRALIRLYEPTAGRIVFEGEDITRANNRALRRHTRRRMAMVFQNPSTSLNPYLRIGDLLLEPLQVHGIGNAAERRDTVATTLERVGLDASAANRYPPELSGGQRQRIGIARALMLEPSLVIADEPTASLDVSVQAQVVNLMKDLQRDLGLAYLFVSHDLALIRHISHRIAVMYLGKIVEIGPAADLFGSPIHPYSVVLASMQREAEHRIVPTGDIPSPIDPPSGCVFRTRCPIARDRCAQEVPALREISPGRHAACHFPSEVQPTGLTALPSHIPPPALVPET